MRNRISVVACIALLASACGGGGSARNTGAVSASSDAQRFGVAAYEVEADRVEVYGVDHQRLAAITVDSSSPTLRHGTIAYANEPAYEFDVDRADYEGNFWGAPVPMGREGYLLADPGLAEFFRAQRLSFRLYDATNRVLTDHPPAIKSEPQNGELWTDKSPSTYPNCNDASVIGNVFGVCGNYSYAPLSTNTLPNYTASTQAACESACGASLYGILTLGTTTCKCYADITVGSIKFATNTTTGGCADQDRYGKERDCPTNGACYNGGPITGAGCGRNYTFSSVANGSIKIDWPAVIPPLGNDIYGVPAGSKTYTANVVVPAVQNSTITVTLTPNNGYRVNVSAYTIPGGSFAGWTGANGNALANTVSMTAGQSFSSPFAAGVLNGFKYCSSNADCISSGDDGADVCNTSTHTCGQPDGNRCWCPYGGCNGGKQLTCANSSCESPNHTCKAWETCYCGGILP